MDKLPRMALPPAPCVTMIGVSPHTGADSRPPGAP